ncbi:MAG: HlyC/CorC family transporter [Acidimicrobiia bacterium]|nr:HlyC/CorC family transporter [Acidimicrobiia bacterium]
MSVPSDLGVDIAGWILVLVFAACAGLMAALDAAVARAGRSRVRMLAEEGSKRAAKLESMFVESDPLPEALIFLRVLFTEATAILAALLLLRHVTGAWLLFALPLAVVLVYLLQRAVGLVVVRRGPTSVAVAAAGVLRLISRVVGPVAVAVALPLRRLQRAPRGTDEGIELRDVLDRASVGEMIEPGEVELLHSVLEFGDTIVRSIMVPRTDMVTVDAEATVGEELDIASRTGLTRLPVREGDVDEIVGLVHLKDLIGREIDHGEPVRHRLRPAHHVPEQKRTVDLLAEMRQARAHLAIVVDEHGGTAGLVTLEDVIEELVGEISDEYDTEEVPIGVGPGGTSRVAGRYPLHDLATLVGARVRVEDADTVAGAMLALLGRVPREGDEVTDPVSGVGFRAVEVNGHRVETVDVSAPTDAPAGLGGVEDGRSAS